MILKGIDPGTGKPFEDDDYKYEALEPLAIDATITVRVQLSTGGPGDQFEFDYSPGDDVPNTIRYSFIDWYDSATVTLEEDDAAIVEDAYGTAAAWTATEGLHR